MGAVIGRQQTRTLNECMFVGLPVFFVHIAPITGAVPVERVQRVVMAGDELSPNILILPCKKSLSQGGKKATRVSASVFINDDESGLHADHERWLEKLAPEKPHSAYDHNRSGEDNADAHLKRQIMGREVVVAITGGALDFGPWEQIFYGEFDGRRKKRVLVKIIGE